MPAALATPWNLRSSLKSLLHFLSPVSESFLSSILHLLCKSFIAIAFQFVLAENGSPFVSSPEETWLKSTLDFMHFESRKSTLKEILDALSNRNFNMIGVYGMGGIGKTTLVKEVGRQVKENNLFEKVISSRVSQTPQTKNIQGEIAEKIGLELTEQSHVCVRIPIALEDIRLISNKDYEAFESRISTLNNALRALQDPDVNMVGIYGMGGIGKTTLAKEVAIQFKRDQLFDQVIFVEVPQIPDIRKIQGEIADKLGLIFFEETESGRARSLYNRLKDEKKILVILDNVWESVDLQDVGIPHGDNHKGCKILMTARSEDILSGKMDCRHNFSVGVLRKDEAWSLFKKMAGESINSSEFKWVATDVANECAGLPVSIVTVARALRNKRLFEWKDALGQLRRPSSTNFKDIQPAAYSAIELSYNKLEGEELKKIFLLIGYTYISSINDVLMYGMGLGLFQGINRMEEARARVYTLVYKLKASCMLLEHGSKNEHWFSMHDVEVQNHKDDSGQPSVQHQE
ncbi:hypothetical protein WN944_007395 [Citrus x changshan-huyou]|uniref:AAA+ ATPase domain-containing protein n=1 Tax=Citrus x changshan-huyou TaxID=2935761 RepID=A0AAP0MR40_9ROSI